jgi:hypothetical protein
MTIETAEENATDRTCVEMLRRKYIAIRIQKNP